MDGKNLQMKMMQMHLGVIVALSLCPSSQKIESRSCGPNGWKEALDVTKNEPKMQVKHWSGYVAVSAHRERASADWPCLQAPCQAYHHRAFSSFPFRSVDIFFGAFGARAPKTHNMPKVKVPPRVSVQLRFTHYRHG